MLNNNKEKKQIVKYLESDKKIIDILLKSNLPFFYGISVIPDSFSLKN